MVVVKQLDPNYPRLGYEVQKGLMIDMPWGDGKAEITESDDGTLTLSEGNGKYTASIKNVRLSEFGEHDIVVKVNGDSDANHLVLEDLNIESPMATIRSFRGDNRVSDTILMGVNDISLAGHTIDDAYIDNSVIMTSSVEKDSLDQLPPTEVGGLFLSSVVKRLKADSLPKDSILRPYTFYTVT